MMAHATNLRLTFTPPLQFDRKAEITLESGQPIARISREFANAGQLFCECVVLRVDDKKLTSLPIQQLINKHTC